MDVTVKDNDIIIDINSMEEKQKREEAYIDRLNIYVALLKNIEEKK